MYEICAKNVISYVFMCLSYFVIRPTSVVFIVLDLKTQQKFVFPHFGSLIVYVNLIANLVDKFPWKRVFEIESFKLTRILSTNYVMHSHVPRLLDAKRISHCIKVWILISILDMNFCHIIIVSNYIDLTFSTSLGTWLFEIHSFNRKHRTCFQDDLIPLIPQSERYDYFDQYI